MKTNFLKNDAKKQMARAIEEKMPVLKKALKNGELGKNG